MQILVQECKLKGITDELLKSSLGLVSKQNNAVLGGALHIEIGLFLTG